MNVVVYCGSNPGNNPQYAHAALKLGEWIGDAGHALVYGGSSVGLMGLISRTVLEHGGEVYGVEPQFFIDAGVEQHNLTELHIVETMSERKAKMIELGDVFIALPGGVGTLEEISEIMSRIRLRLSPGPCFCLNINDFYTPLAHLLDNMHDHCFIEKWDRDAFQFPTSVEDLIERLAQWHLDASFDGRPVVPERQEKLLLG